MHFPKFIMPLNGARTVLALGRIFLVSLCLAGATNALADNAELYITKAEEALRKGQVGPAVRHYNRALSYEPGQLEVSNVLSDLLIGQKRYEEAQRVLDAAFVETPKDAHLWLKQGRLYNKQGQSSEAEAAYARAVSLGKNDPVIQRRGAAFYRDQGQSGVAQALSQRAVLLDGSEQ